MDVLIRYLHSDSNGTRLTWVQDVAEAVPSYPPRYAFSPVAAQAEATRFAEDEALELLASYAGRTWTAAELVPVGDTADEAAATTR